MPQTNEVTWSPELLRIFGVRKAPATDQEFSALLYPEDRMRVEAETSTFLGSDARSYSHTFRILRPDGQVRMVLDRAVIERDAVGKVTAIRGVNIDVTDEFQLSHEVADKLRASEGRYRKLFNAIDEGFCVVEVLLDGPGGKIDYRVVEANPAFYALTGFPEAIRGSWLREAAPGLEEHWFQTYGSVARTGESIRFENQSELLGRWFDVFAFPIDDDDARRVAILFNDITDRKHQDDQTMAMIDEINHRSKNMLGVIQVIARQTSVAGPQDFLERFGHRVRALTASNDLLARNGWGSVALDELIRSQLSPFEDGVSQRIALDGPPVTLGSVATRALGMAFHELATNAAKYGALSVPEGTIQVKWSLEPAERLSVQWIEAGGPPVTVPLRTGFGSKVTKQMVESSLGGTVSVNFAPNGLLWDCSALLKRAQE